MNGETIGLYAMAALYVAAGANHFRVPSFYLPMMPPYIPAHKFMVLVSGVAEIVLGLALIPELTRAPAAWLIIAMLIVFLTVHVYMWQERDGKFAKLPKIALLLRFPFQAVLIWWAWLYTA